MRQDLDPICDLAGSHGLVTAPWKIGICEFLLLVRLSCSAELARDAR